MIIAALQILKEKAVVGRRVLRGNHLLVSWWWPYYHLLSTVMANMFYVTKHTDNANITFRRRGKAPTHIGLTRRILAYSLSRGDSCPSTDAVELDLYRSMTETPLVSQLEIGCYSNVRLTFRIPVVRIPNINNLPYLRSTAVRAVVLYIHTWLHCFADACWFYHDVFLRR